MACTILSCYQAGTAALGRQNAHAHTRKLQYPSVRPQRHTQQLGKTMTHKRIDQPGPLPHLPLSTPLPPLCPIARPWRRTQAPRARPSLGGTVVPLRVRAYAAAARSRQRAHVPLARPRSGVLAAPASASMHLRPAVPPSSSAHRAAFCPGSSAVVCAWADLCRGPRVHTGCMGPSDGHEQVREERSGWQVRVYVLWWGALWESCRPPVCGRHDWDGLDRRV
ncbi:hypothetical protein C8Q80DRAFT_877436 [Daedaleopsis nitida]|nr:hypothetical protein C8Q80DRAFT_877436 [Daedaleopsis nitida]